MNNGNIISLKRKPLTEVRAFPFLVFIQDKRDMLMP